MNTKKQRGGDWLELVFLDREKINKIMNFNIPLILVVIVADQSMMWFLVDGGSSCNMLYADMLKLLGIQQSDQKPYSGGDLLAFNNSMISHQEMIDLIVADKEGARERKVILNFLIVPCKSAYKGILKNSLLANLDVVALPVHLKITYHDVEGRLVAIIVDFKEARWILVHLSGDILALILGAYEEQGNYATYELDPRKVEVRPIPNIEFEFLLK